ncbi:MAG: type I glyceraldehyde-3-phosphate dehydrogenase [Bdellovibrionales bacterium]
MTARVAINGFGRIGRLTLRAYLEHQNLPFQVVAINELAPVPTSAHLLQFDSVHGRLKQSVSVSGEELMIGNHKIAMVHESDPAKLPWKDMGIDIVLECSGRFTKRDAAAKHLSAGAKRVFISAPATDEDITVVYGVNHKDVKAGHSIIANGSCTTNCLVPVVVALQQAFGIVHGFVTTVHSYTADQRLVDTAHDDLQRARAAAQNMVPASTGAAKAVFKVLPELKGKLDGVAVRVPTANVSMIDLTAVVTRPVTIEEVNAALVKAAAGMNGVMAVTDKPLVSSDFNHDPHSATVALGETKVVDGTFVRVLAWYDNEWGFVNRMIDVTSLLAA